LGSFFGGFLGGSFSQESLFGSDFGGLLGSLFGLSSSLLFGLSRQAIPLLLESPSETSKI